MCVRDMVLVFFWGFARLGRGLNGVGLVGLVGLAGLLNFEGVC